MNQNQKMSTENQIGNIHEYSTKEKKGLLFPKTRTPRSDKCSSSQLLKRTNVARKWVKMLFSLCTLKHTYVQSNTSYKVWSPLRGMTCLKRNQYIGQNLGFDSLNDNGCAGGHFVYYRTLPRAFIKALSRGIFK